MSLIDSLTSEDLPLSYRFPRWNSALYYPCASIVIFDIDTGTADSEIEYHIFVAERDINPTLDSDNPHASVISMDGRWRDLTGKAITDISSTELPVATGTEVTLTINFDDLTSEDVSFIIPTPPGGGADSESVAIRVATDGTLSFGSNFADDDTARAAIRDLIQVDFERLVFTQVTDGFEAMTYTGDDGMPNDITATSFANGHLFIQTTAVPPVMPVMFNPTFSLLSHSILNWDEPATRFTFNVNNPQQADFQGASFITPVRIAVSTGGLTAGDVTDLGTFSATESGSGTPMTGERDFIYTDAIPLGNGMDTAYIRPFVDPSINSRTVVEEESNPSSITLRGTVDVTGAPAGSGVPSTLTEDVTISWHTPRLDEVSWTLSTLSGKTFLKTYDEASFTITANTGGVSAANISHTASTPSGSIITPNAPNDPLSDSTANINPPFHKDTVNANTNILTVDTIFSRPASVVGHPYNAVDASSAAFPTPTFDRPRFWFTTNDTILSTVPDISLIIDDSTTTGFNISATSSPGMPYDVTGNIVNFQGTGNDLIGTGDPVVMFGATTRLMWFAEPASNNVDYVGFDVVNQGLSFPQSFRVPGDPLNPGSGAVRRNNIMIAPNNPPVGYVAELYNLTGMFINNNIVRITIV